MLKFPLVSQSTEPPLPKMSLREYCDFCEECLRSNSHITPENCMTKRTDEANMQPFRFPPQNRK